MLTVPHVQHSTRVAKKIAVGYVYSNST